ncbi:TRAP transporter small permease [Pontibacillus marinus]|uniref:Tripartite ATP-independent periplasmic transporters DctQ component domain-containing protein n=1 Tax=Pontibacillus marinus BH030004 = DSM 16465 TaxID=1385511 RepID=A0A0A5G6E3_9BACI|nr:TRAP transporter small permease [Pontibacillus marinus]KGX86660.1 hypothetical protein N783_11725 [Pontibacillus marinus BH030004 = DSM 16465]
MAVLKKISDGIYKLEAVVISLAILIIFVSLTLSVIFRYFLDNPLEWSSELSLYGLAWTTFIGASITIKRQQSAAVTMVYEKVPEKVQKGLKVFIQLVVVCFAAYMFYISFGWITQPTISSQKSLGMEIPLFYPYLCVPIGFLFMTIHSLYLLLDSIRTSKRDNL